MQAGMGRGLPRESTAHGPAARLDKVSKGDDSKGVEIPGVMGDTVGRTSSIGEGNGTALG